MKTDTLKFQIVNLLVNVKGLALTPQDLEAWKERLILKLGVIKQQTRQSNGV